HHRAFVTEQSIDAAGLEQMHTAHADARQRLIAALDAEAYDIDIEQHREVGRHHFDQMLKAGRGEQSQYRFVNAALRGDVVAADRNQIVLVGAQPLNLGAQTLDHEVLQVDHAVAPPFHRRVYTREVRP